MSVVGDCGEWVRAFEVDLYSFSYIFAAGFKWLQSISLKTSFLLTIYSVIKQKSHDFLSGEKRRSNINFPVEEDMDGKSRWMSRRRLVLLETKNPFGTETDKRQCRLSEASIWLSKRNKTKGEWTVRAFFTNSSLFVH